MAKCEQLAFGWASEASPSAASTNQDREAIATLARELAKLCPPAGPVLDNSLPLAGPVHQTPAEIHALTKVLADVLINLIEGFRQVETWLADPQCSDCARLYHERDAILLKYRHVVAVYCRDFGRGAADCLEAYAHQRARSFDTSRQGGNTS